MSINAERSGSEGVKLAAQTELSLPNVTSWKKVRLETEPTAQILAKGYSRSYNIKRNYFPATVGGAGSPIALWCSGLGPKFIGPYEPSSAESRVIFLLHKMPENQTLIVQ